MNICECLHALIKRIEIQEDIVLDCCPDKAEPWKNKTDYIKGDLVKHAGKVWICLESHTSSAQNNPPSEYWGEV